MLKFVPENEAIIKSIPINNMKIKLIATIIISQIIGIQAIVAQSNGNNGETVAAGDRQIVFNLSDAGKSLPILWGLDTAWPSRENMIRGARFMTPEVVKVARVSFQPWAKIEEKGVLPELLMGNLKERMDIVSLIGHKVDIALNFDGGENMLHDVYDGQALEWALLIDATAAAVEGMGYKVVSAAPFNEPDDPYNGLTDLETYDKRKLYFNRINLQLKNYENFPRFENIRISGGNTLNSDEAILWYDLLKTNLDEGNTHQLAGSFDNYARFFEKVRADGKYATADELHNVMEAMVGVEYGMQTGIWWGTADLVRGEFCQASDGVRLAYGENRQAWSSGAVYRSPSGKVQAFVGCSERQAEPSSYRFISAEEDVYFDGVGPTREFTTFMPGDYDTYQGPNQTSAEAVINITRGEDVQPAVGNATYVIMNVGLKKAMEFESDENLVKLTVGAPSDANLQKWNVERVPNTVGGDYSGYYIKNYGTEKSVDMLNWTLEKNGDAIQWGFGGGHNQQWYLEYAGENNFRIRSRWSGYYLTASSDDSHVRQQEKSEDANQLWRILESGKDFDTTAPQTPTELKATANSNAVELSWTAPSDNDVTSYTVLRSTREGEYNTIARDVKTTAYKDNNTVPGETYGYKVIAQDASLNRSMASSEVKVNTANGQTLRADIELNGTIADTSGNDFILRANNTATYTEGPTDGKEALEMDGDQWVQLPYTLLQLKEMTVAMSVKRGSASGRKLLNTGIAGRSELTLYAEKDGNVALEAKKDGTTAGSVTATAAAPGEWMHVAVVASNGKMKLYTDGTEAGEADMPLEPEEMLLSYLGRGQESANEGENFEGAIAGLKVYSYALPAEDIARLANGSSGIKDVTEQNAAVSVKYYDASGRETAEPQRGSVVVKQTVYTSGRVTTEKITIK